MISDVKLLHHFLLINVINRDVFLTLKLFIKQFQSTTYSVNAGKLLRLSKYYCKLLLFQCKCFEVWIAIWMDTIINIFSVQIAK